MHEELLYIIGNCETPDFAGGRTPPVTFAIAYRLLLCEVIYMNDEHARLKQTIRNSGNIVFFGGAGVSTESGIPDFRSEDGIYNIKYAYPPEMILSHSFFMRNTSEFYRFFRDKMLHPHAKPNKAHYALAQLESQGKLKAVVTQNVDGLHHKAGSVNVLELHGSCSRYYCLTCGMVYTADVVLESEDIPLCSCGGIIRPDVVLFEECWIKGW